MATGALLVMVVLAADGSPAELSNRYFYDAEFAAEVLAGRYDPFKHFTAEPQSLHFTTPGSVTIGLGQDSETCTVSAQQKGAGYALTAKCASKPRAAIWSWTGPGRARTNLFDFGDGAPVEVAALDLSPADIERDAGQRLAKRVLPPLAGDYADAAGARLTLAPDGRVTLQGKTRPARVFECLDGCSDSSVKTLCLDLEKEPKDLMAVATDAGMLLVEAETTGLCGDGPSHEKLEKGRVFRRK